MAAVTVDEVFALAASLKGRTLKTATRGREFRVEVHGDSLLITPLSSGKERKHERRTIKVVCDHFNKTGSLRPCDYQDVTYNASYSLALIDMLANGTAGIV